MATAPTIRPYTPIVPETPALPALPDPTGERDLRGLRLRHQMVANRQGLHNPHLSNNDIRRSLHAARFPVVAQTAPVPQQQQSQPNPPHAAPKPAAPPGQTLAGRICGKLPTGSVTSVAMAGTMVGPSGSIDVVTNFRTGQTTAFFSPGYQIGLYTLGASATKGYAWGTLGKDNENFKGGFSGAVVGGDIVTGSIITSSGGPMHPTTGIHPFAKDKVTVVSVGVQTPGVAIAVNSTYSLSMGNMNRIISVINMAPDAALVIANQACAARGY